MGGPAGLLQIGQDHSVASVVAEQLPDAPAFEGIGHDGQLFYVIGLDLTGRRVAEQMAIDESVPYRYRRIAYPALASAFGALDGSKLLWGLILVNVAAAGIAAGSTAWIARLTGRSPWLALAVLFNPGVWQSARLLTADNLALAAGLLAVAAFLAGRLPLTAVALALAALSKETAVAFMLGLAGYCFFHSSRRMAVGLAAATLVPLVTWYLYIERFIGSALDSSGNLSAPLVGIIDSIGMWPGRDVVDIVWTVVTFGFLAIATVAVVVAPSLWRWLVSPWLVVALLSSPLVWHAGNNSVRVFAPLLVLAVLGIANRTKPTPASP